MRTATDSTWNARLEMRAPAEQVLDALTDPEVCGRWSPIDFDVEELEGDRLVAGSRARIAGRLAGARVCFDIEVFEGGPERLALRASGPVVLDVDYRLAPASRSVHRGERLGDRRRRVGACSAGCSSPPRGACSPAVRCRAPWRASRARSRPSREAPAFAS